MHMHTIHANKHMHSCHLLKVKIMQLECGLVVFEKRGEHIAVRNRLAGDGRVDCLLHRLHITNVCCNVLNK